MSKVKIKPLSYLICFVNYNNSNGLMHVCREEKRMLTGNGKKRYIFKVIH